MPKNSFLRRSITSIDSLITASSSNNNNNSSNNNNNNNNNNSSSSNNNCSSNNSINNNNSSETRVTDFGAKARASSNKFGPRCVEALIEDGKKKRKLDQQQQSDNLDVTTQEEESCGAQEHARRKRVRARVNVDETAVLFGFFGVNK